MVAADHSMRRQRLVISSIEEIEVILNKRDSGMSMLKFNVLERKLVIGSASEVSCSCDEND